MLGRHRNNGPPPPPGPFHAGPPTKIREAIMERRKLKLNKHEIDFRAAKIADHKIRCGEAKLSVGTLSPAKISPSREYAYVPVSVEVSMDEIEAYTDGQYEGERNGNDQR